MRNILLSLCLIMLFASGCTKPGLVGSFCGPLPERGTVSAIAADAVACLSALYPPGHTSLHLLQAKDAGNDFAAAFESTTSDLLQNHSRYSPTIRTIISLSFSTS